MNHPLRGSCEPGCDLYGLCHCGCGGETVVSPINKPVQAFVAGRPRVYLKAHHRAPAVDTKPLIELLKSRSRDTAVSGMNSRHGIMELGRRYAEAVGLKPNAAERAIQRVMHGSRVSVYEADRLCCFLGKHPAEVYGEEWWNA